MIIWQLSLNQLMWYTALATSDFNAGKLRFGVQIELRIAYFKQYGCISSFLMHDPSSRTPSACFSGFFFAGTGLGSFVHVVD